MKTWIVDIDGTVADNGHRIHYITNGSKDWEAWHKYAHLDKPITPMVELLNMAKASGIKIVLCTGRDEKCRKDTVYWFNYHHIPYDELYMRKAGDRRDDDVVKYELLEQIRADGYDPILVFDDRERVVKMWRNQGLLCYQVAPGDF